MEQILTEQTPNKHQICLPTTTTPYATSITLTLHLGRGLRPMPVNTKDFAPCKHERSLFIFTVAWLIANANIISLRAFWYLEKPENKGFVVIDVAYRYLTVGYSLPSTTTNHVFKERNTTMSKIIFAMYNQETDSVEVTLDNQFHITFNCQNCNAQVKLTSPLNISYLPRLAREEPGFYASLASRKGGLQGYVEAMGSLIRCFLFIYYIH